MHEDAIEKGMLIKDIPEPNRTGVLKVVRFVGGSEEFQYHGCAGS